MTDRLQTHGVLITFRRHDALAEHLERLAAQTMPLTSLLVVDNDNDPSTRVVIEQHPGAAEEILYIGVDDNPGPAGGIAAGIDAVLDLRSNDDWLVLLDDDDPPRTDDTLEMLAAAAENLAETYDSVGGVGLWGARLQRYGRLRSATGQIPEEVIYLPGGAIPHYHIGTLRKAGGPDPSLFFGFDDLDLGLAFERANATLWSGGFARQLGLSSMVEGRRVSTSVSDATWRRYYSLRNLVIILRRNGRTSGALAMSVLAGIAKPLLNLPMQPRQALRNLRLNFVALRHGWQGETGKRLDPLDLPLWLR